VKKERSGQEGRDKNKGGKERQKSEKVTHLQYLGVICQGKKGRQDEVGKIYRIEEKR